MHQARTRSRLAATSAQCHHWPASAIARSRPFHTSSFATTYVRRSVVRQDPMPRKRRCSGRLGSFRFEVAVVGNPKKPGDARGVRRFGAGGTGIKDKFFKERVMDPVQVPPLALGGLLEAQNRPNSPRREAIRPAGEGR
jgi:hypothetical protein